MITDPKLWVKLFGAPIFEPCIRLEDGFLVMEVVTRFKKALFGQSSRLNMGGVA